MESIERERRLWRRQNCRLRTMVIVAIAVAVGSNAAAIVQTKVGADATDRWRALAHNWESVASRCELPTPPALEVPAWGGRI